MEMLPMKRSIFLLGTALAICLADPAAAAKGAAPFGCEARKPAVCYFRIFYLPRHNRQVVLPAGMKTIIPDVDIGRDQYCVAIGAPPAHKCARKTITAKENN
jgi:hypothetical protein